MPQTDTRLIIPADIATALSLLTRLPVPKDSLPEDREPALAAWAYPVAGIVVALIAAGIGLICKEFGASNGVCAAAILICLVMSTGALHEDGLADTADGLWGGWDADRRLKIMKDSNIGTYGVVALVLSLLVRWSALAAVLGAGYGIGALLCAAALSRAAMVGVMATLPNVRSEGLSHETGRPGVKTVQAAAAIGFVAAVIFFQLGAVWLVLLAVAGTFAMRALAQNKIGGQTGDILGATQQVVEVLVLAGVTVLL